MNWFEPNSLQLIIADLNEIAADAYHHRIRPVSKKGGGGAYNANNGGLAYTLPKRFEANRRARFAIQALSADFILLRATSLNNASLTVTAMIDDRGKLRNILYPKKEPPPSSDFPNTPPAFPKQSTMTVTKVFEDPLRSK